MNRFVTKLDDWRMTGAEAVAECAVNVYYSSRRCLPNGPLSRPQEVDPYQGGVFYDDEKEVPSLPSLRPN